MRQVAVCSLQIANVSTAADSKVPPAPTNKMSPERAYFRWLRRQEPEARRLRLRLLGFPSNASQRGRRDASIRIVIVSVALQYAGVI